MNVALLFVTLVYRFCKGKNQSLLDFTLFELLVHKGSLVIYAQAQH